MILQSALIFWIGGFPFHITNFLLLNYFFFWNDLEEKWGRGWGIIFTNFLMTTLLFYQLFEMEISLGDFWVGVKWGL